MKGCEELAEKAGIPWVCCDSCHDDFDLGFDYHDVLFDEEWYGVCCTMVQSLEKVTP